MRSRYAAYALGLAEYIIDTTDPDGPAWEGGGDDASRARWLASIQRFSRTMTFRALRIVATTMEGPAAGTVHFRAELSQDGRPGAMEELSRFVHRGGNWRYTAGEQRR